MYMVRGGLFDDVDAVLSCTREIAMTPVRPPISRTNPQSFGSTASLRTRPQLRSSA